MVTWRTWVIEMGWKFLNYRANNSLKTTAKSETLGHTKYWSWLKETLEDTGKEWCRPVRESSGWFLSELRSLKLLWEGPCLSWRDQYLSLCKKLHSCVDNSCSLELDVALCALQLVTCCQCSWEQRGCSSRKALLKWPHLHLNYICSMFANIHSFYFFLHYLRGFLPSMHCLYHPFCFSLFNSYSFSHQRPHILITIPFVPP